MEKTKLIALLKTFDSKELRAFGDFVKSPFFNKNDEIEKLYFHLKKLAGQTFPPKKMKKELIFKKLFPSEAYEERRFNHTISQLLKLAERFISLNEYDQNGILNDYHTMIAYNNRNLEKNYVHILRKAKEKLGQVPFRDASYYYQQFLIADAEAKRFDRKNIRAFDNSLQEVSDALDLYFLSQKLKFLVGMLDREKQLSVKYQHHMMPEVRTYVERENFESIPPIVLYYTTLQTLTEEQSSEYFLQLKELLVVYKDQFPRTEIKEFFYCAINYCINKIRSGEKDYTADLVELYEKGLQQEVLLEEGKISPWTFKNVVKLSLGLGRFDWVEQFVKSNYEKLDKQFREEALHFSLADLNYHRKNYDDSLFHLNQVEFSDIYYWLDGKVMLLKIYHENNETEALLSLIQSFRIYLKRNKRLSDNIKETYLNFTNILYEIQRKADTKAAMLLEKIKETRWLTARSWLEQTVKK